MLSAACCLLHVVCCLLHVAFRLLHMGQHVQRAASGLVKRSRGQAWAEVLQAVAPSMIERRSGGAFELIDRAVGSR
jgi:hypothetical protein